jgi:hypothetical protein
LALDYVITGGPDWNPGAQAYAMELRRLPQAEQPNATVLGFEAPPTQPAAIIAQADYSLATEDLLGAPFDIYADYVANTKNELVMESAPTAAALEASKPGAL